MLAPLPIPITMRIIIITTIIVTMATASESRITHALLRLLVVVVVLTDPRTEHAQLVAIEVEEPEAHLRGSITQPTYTRRVQCPSHLPRFLRLSPLSSGTARIFYPGGIPSPSQ